MSRAVAEANTNIALVKYWGKRPGAFNLPAVGSLSLTLEGLSTRTEVRFDDKLAADSLTLNGNVDAGPARDKVAVFLDLVRALAKTNARAAVQSANNFPTAAGLASSASAFAALALAATRAAGLELDGRALSVLARQGSGSAARSIFGGLVRMHKGELTDGSDAFAEHIDDGRWGVRMVIAVTSEAQKSTLSTDGMTRTARTSPFFAPWIVANEEDLKLAEQAIAARDLDALGVVTEASAMTMHASAMAARPAVIYLKGVTLDGFHAVQAMRKDGVRAYFTCDAGPHAKALTDEKNAAEVARRLAEVPGVLRTHICAPGPAARIVE